MTSKTVSTIEVGWNEPADPGFSYYLVEYYPPDGRQPASTEVAKSSPRATLEGLTPDRLYKVTVYTVATDLYPAKGESAELCQRTGENGLRRLLSPGANFMQLLIRKNLLSKSSWSGKSHLGTNLAQYIAYRICAGTLF